MTGETPTPTPTATTTTTTTATTNNAPTAAAPTTNRVLVASSNSVSSLKPALAFQRFEQACQRLRWKYIDLQASYKRALAPDEAGFSGHDAERNFKVDFHEFYVWIEQAMVLLLLVFDVVVPRDRQAFNSTDANRRGGGTYNQSPHAYHHNVLKTLDDEDNPLHAVLGRGDVSHALWKAKELRNRWKDAAEGRETPPLKMYDLSWIVTTVLGGLEVSYEMAAARVEEVKLAEPEPEPEEEAGLSWADMTIEQEQEAARRDAEDRWEWMVEPMDWET